MHASVQVQCAISRATKEKRVAELEEALRNSTVAFGVRFNKVSVRRSAARFMWHSAEAALGYWPRAVQWNAASWTLLAAALQNTCNAIPSISASQGSWGVRCQVAVQPAEGRKGLLAGWQGQDAHAPEAQGAC